MVNELERTFGEFNTNYFEKYGEAASQRAIVGRLLKFSKFGEFLAGQENEQIGIGTELVAYMPSLAVGYIRWSQNRPSGSEMGYIGEGYRPPKRNDLGDSDESEWDTDDRGNPRDPWQFTNSLMFLDTSAPCVYTFNTSSKGGLGAIGKLSRIYGTHLKTKPRDLPTIKLGVSSYKHPKKEYGEIRVPTFEVITAKWVSVDDLPHFEDLPPLREIKYIPTTLKQDMKGDEIPF